MSSVNAAAAAVAQYMADYAAALCAGFMALREDPFLQRVYTAAAVMKLAHRCCIPLPLLLHC